MGQGPTQNVKGAQKTNCQTDKKWLMVLKKKRQTDMQTQNVKGGLKINSKKDKQSKNVINQTRRLIMVKMA